MLFQRFQESPGKNTLVGIVNRSRERTGVKALPQRASKDLRAGPISGVTAPMREAAAKKNSPQVPRGRPTAKGPQVKKEPAPAAKAPPVGVPTASAPAPANPPEPAPKQPAFAQAPQSPAKEPAPPPAASVRSPERMSRLVLCQWPIGEPGNIGFHFCSAPVVPGKPYCADHTGLAFVKVRDRREDAG
ncbi:MAG: GcrA cell cycle regulator [Patescibacteria group bacterium]|nr:GcrA cell cycle regulator [Patescibacteria group bacterium]MDE1944346.1 GcrA cell cycle regulator [Patescibacteria group bacterium]MDE1945340.1 GcrA cell cycle regulator [Patescibacteria group bacterium]MDE2057696.1 GcrA cell cycle regulator [Patescibacteria group bacterium]